MPRAPTILIVEDNRDLALGLEVNFEEHGYAVTLAHTGSEALRHTGIPKPDLVLLDLSLPDIDGFELLERMRRRGDETPVIVLTARGNRDARLRGLRTGADDYVTKPFDIEELLL